MQLTNFGIHATALQHSGLDTVHLITSSSRLVLSNIDIDITARLRMVLSFTQFSLILLISTFYNHTAVRVLHAFVVSRYYTDSPQSTSMSIRPTELRTINRNRQACYGCLSSPIHSMLWLLPTHLSCMH